MKHAPSGAVGEVSQPSDDNSVIHAAIRMQPTTTYRMSKNAKLARRASVGMTLLLLLMALEATHLDLGWMMLLLLVWGCAAFFGAFWAALTIVISLREKDPPGLRWAIVLLVLCVLPVCWGAVRETWGHLFANG